MRQLPAPVEPVQMGPWAPHPPLAELAPPPSLQLNVLPLSPLEQLPPCVPVETVTMIPSQVADTDAYGCATEHTPWPWVPTHTPTLFTQPPWAEAAPSTHVTSPWLLLHWPPVVPLLTKTV